MARSPNIFIDPAGVVPSYSWEINHSEEESIAKSRQMADGAATDNMGMIPQQGAATPLILSWKGTILTKNQLDKMLQFWELCEEQSIYIQDFSGASYEIIITDFQPQRVAAARNPRDQANAPLWTWSYTLIMRVLQVFSGDWVGVTP